MTDAIREHLAKRVVELEAERDALAAHVDRIASLRNPLGRRLAETAPALGRILEQTPTTSLARRDARMKAEALEEFAEDFGRFRGLEHAIQPCELDDRARELRRQAEGPHHD